MKKYKVAGMLWSGMLCIVLGLIMINPGLLLFVAGVILVWKAYLLDTTKPEEVAECPKTQT